MSRPGSGADRLRRSLGIVRATVGMVLVGRPEVVLSRLGAGTDVASRRAARVLGGRDVVQGLLTAAGNPWARSWLRAIDAGHAVSMVGLAAADPRRRRVALVSAGLATVWAVAAGR